MITLIKVLISIKLAIIKNHKKELSQKVYLLNLY